MGLRRHDNELQNNSCANPGLDRFEPTAANAGNINSPLRYPSLKTYLQSHKPT